jgi:hypothetical protein
MNLFEFMNHSPIVTVICVALICSAVVQVVKAFRRQKD